MPTFCQGGRDTHKQTGYKAHTHTHIHNTHISRHGWRLMLCSSVSLFLSPSLHKSQRESRRWMEEDAYIKMKKATKQRKHLVTWTQKIALKRQKISFFVKSESKGKTSTSNYRYLGINSRTKTAPKWGCSQTVSSTILHPLQQTSTFIQPGSVFLWVLYFFVPHF